MSEADAWSETGARITDVQVLERLRTVLAEEGSVIVEHRFYRGSRAPSRRVFDDFEALSAYLKEQTRPGDSFRMWSFESTCTDARVLEMGKVPDKLGRVPQGGAY
ncbi:hypothetical protein [Pyxidicoccus trucidator]|uniref:hypothetical protein n=1 Tax=Pyxidicoccus trucidator TaxID=2709662 RepID=UPI0013DACB5B|nr:hypothetical protein [Pyxidicoccus trucidator]